MKKSLLSLLVVFGMQLSAENLEQTFYFDFGSITASQGTKTEGADSNGNYWNNITNNTSGNKYAASGTVYDGIVNSRNETVPMKVTLNSRFSTNGKSGGGGLLSPDASLLGDLAVATATEDYFFIESNENNSNFTISGLDPDKGYRFSVFASRKAADSRIGGYTMEGINSFKGQLALAGTNLGGDGINQNIAEVLVSSLVYPDDDGNILFTVSRVNGAYIALNAMKMEEYSGGNRPGAEPTVVSAEISGSAAENGQSLAMYKVSPDGKKSSVFEAFAMLNPGDFVIRTSTDQSTQPVYGLNGDGLLAEGGDAVTVDKRQLSFVRIDLSSGELIIVPITSMDLVGSVVPGGWNASGGTPIEYRGNGVWSATVNLDRVSTASDPERFIFVMNKSWDYQFKRVSGTEHTVGLASDGYTLDDIRLNHGTYTITLDLNDFVYYIENPAGIDEMRISVMGSSVANGQGATDNHGYAWMYGELLKQRAAEGRSDNAFYTSGISINGNNTVNLLGRYNDLIHDFGRYVVFGVSLGNEGIHGAADQEAVFNQFKNNMAVLIEKARKDGKVPVVMNNYTRGDFNESDYEWVKRMNLLIHQWDLPSVNLLGAIDNGAGRWADGHQAGDDIYHPSTDGHREFLYSMVPSLFDALSAGKPLPERSTGNSFRLTPGRTIVFTPEEVAHSFTLVLNLNELPAGQLAEIAVGDGTASLVADASSVTYQSVAGDRISAPITRSAEASLVLTHYYAQGRTVLYLDGHPAGEISEKIAPGKITVANPEATVDMAELMFFRSGMNADEVTALGEGKMLKSSLEMYVPFAQDKPFENRAQSLNEIAVTGSSGIVAPEIGTEAGFRAAAVASGVVVDCDSPIEVAVHSVDGRCFFRQTVAGTMKIDLQPGLYIVNSLKIAVI